MERSRKTKSTRAFSRADTADTSEEGLKRASISLCHDLSTRVYSASPYVCKQVDQKSERERNVRDRQEAGDRDISAVSPIICYILTLAAAFMLVFINLS